MPSNPETPSEATKHIRKRGQTKQSVRLSRAKAARELREHDALLINEGAKLKRNGLSLEAFLQKTWNGSFGVPLGGER